MNLACPAPNLLPWKRALEPDLPAFLHWCPYCQTQRGVTEGRGHLRRPPPKLGCPGGGLGGLGQRKATCVWS